MKYFFKHLHTVNTHRRLVRRECFKLGLYWQGLTHDLSKYSPAEFLVGARYYQGFCSPNKAERDEKGFSEAWMHHKGRNKHHYEYWLDFFVSENERGINPVEMPAKYFCESVCDRIAACKVYAGEKYTSGDALAYFMKRERQDYMHERTAAEFIKVLTMLKDEGEEKTFEYLRKMLKEAKKAEK